MLAHRRVRVARSSTPPLGDWLVVNGKAVHYLVLGTGPDLVLIHGSNGNMRDMTMSIAYELSTRYRVILFDRPGHGYTEAFDPQGDHIKDQALLFRDVALMLGATRPVVVGHSFGGAIGLAWAINAPQNIAGLIPLSAVSNTWTTGLTLFYTLASAPIIGKAYSTFVAAFAPEPRIHKNIAGVYAPDPVPHGYRANFGVDMLLRPKSIHANALQRKTLVNQIDAQVAHYSDISIPVDIIHGTDDDTVPFQIHAQKLVEQIPQARLTPLEGIGHMPHHAAPKDVIAAIDRMFDNIPPNTSEDTHASL